MEESIVKVEHLSHRYSVQWAIRDINFEITENGIYGLLGSNGAGKSTTMNIMCGVLNQTEGEVYINGINFREDPIAAKMNIGFLPQKPPLYTDLTVEEYLAYCADLRSVAPKKIRSSAAAEERQPAAAPCGGLHRPATGGRRILRRPRTAERRYDEVLPTSCGRFSRRMPFGLPPRDGDAVIGIPEALRRSVVNY